MFYYFDFFFFSFFNSIQRSRRSRGSWTRFDAREIFFHLLIFLSFSFFYFFISCFFFPFAWPRPPAGGERTSIILLQLIVILVSYVQLCVGNALRWSPHLPRAGDQTIQKTFLAKKNTRVLVYTINNIPRWNLLSVRCAIFFFLRIIRILSWVNWLARKPETIDYEIGQSSWVDSLRIPNFGRVFSRVTLGGRALSYVS